MSKKFIRIISLLLVLCMLPITAIVASARGRGVYPTNTENQSLHNAESQYIPETVYIDGILNDTAWDESKWNEVDSTTGYWSVQTLTDTQKALTYKYQIRADYEHVYIGARFAIPEVNSATFTVMFKDSAESGEGYTDKIVFNIKTSKETDCVSISESDLHGITLSAYNENGALKPEESVIASKKMTEDGKTYYTLEFRNRIKDTFSSIENVTYYVSVDLTYGNNTEPESLYHPLVALNDGAKFPTYTDWPMNNDGKPGGVPVDTTYAEKEDDLNYEVTVDGKFDEAVWSSLTNYHINGSKAEDAYNYDNLFDKDGDHSEYVNLDSFKYSKGSNLADNGMKFKYEIRIDGDYLYGAVVAYVPDFTPYYGKTTSTAYSATDFKIAPAPDLYVYFYDNKRDVAYGGDNSKKDELNKDGIVLPEAVVQIRNYTSWKEYSGTADSEKDHEIQTATSPDKVKCSYADIYAYKQGSSDSDAPIAATEEAIDGTFWWGNYLDNNQNKVEVEGTRAQWYGDIYTFEFKVDLDYIPTYDAVESIPGEEIVYGVCLGDRLQINGLTKVDDGTTVTRPLVWSAEGKQAFYFAEAQYAEGNCFTEEQINAAKDKENNGKDKLVVAEKDIFTDGNLAQEFWAGLTSADDIVAGKAHSNVDGVSSADGNIDRFAYKITSDYEFLYGACILEAKDAWNANETLTFYLQRKMSELEKRETSEDSLLNINSSNTKVTAGTPYGATYNTNLAILTDKQKVPLTNPYSFGHPETFCAWGGGTHPTIQFELEELCEVSQVIATFCGGGDSGIWFPKGFKIEYSVDGTYFDEIDANDIELTTDRISTDPEPTVEDDGSNRYFHIDDYIIKHKNVVTAKYIKITVTPDGKFTWLSEVGIKGVPSKKAYKHYELSLDLVQSNQKITLQQDGTAIDIANIQYAIIDIGNNKKAVEFRVPLNSLGVKLNLDENKRENVIFGYYMSTDDGKGNTLYHPKNEPQTHPSEIQTIQRSDYDGAKQFTYGDMLQDIVIDGELNEKYWIGDNVEMTHVDSTNGSYEKEPTKGNSLDFDYKIYAGENYLYGAAIIDESAVMVDKEYNWSNSPSTRFDIWIDNKRDELTWVQDGYSNTVPEISVDNLIYEESSVKCDQVFENYYYNIYISGAKADVSSACIDSPSGGYACGGSTPAWFNDQNNQGKATYIEKENWRWAATTINGKTYVEFMISLDNFHCDRTEGFNYYVSASHVYDKGTENEESLTLIYPQINNETYHFWVTHKNWNTKSPDTGAGIIYDNYQNFASIHGKTTDKNGYGWWGRAIFIPNGNGEYKLIWKNNADGKTYTEEELKAVIDGLVQEYGDLAGGFAYAVHSGHGQEGNSAEIYEAQEIIYNAFVSNQPGYNSLNEWNVGDTFKFTGINLGNITGLTTLTTGSAALQSPVYTIINDDGSYPKHTEDGYECNYTVTRTAKGAISQAAEDNAYAANIPGANVWDSVNAGKIDAIEHFAPDVITVDGDLNENVWNEKDGWTDVHDRINASYQEGTSNNSNAEYSYKIRFDDEYMYVGAIIDAEYGETEAPNFRIWIKSAEEATTFTHFYRIAFSKYSGFEVTLEKPVANYETIDGEDFDVNDRYGYREDIRYSEKYSEKDGEVKGFITYENTLVFGENNRKTPVGTTDFTENSDYESSAFYGYNEEIQENTAWQFYPEIRSTKYYVGKESANMKATADGKTQVEFKVKLDEFDGKDGFEYFVQAGKIVGDKYATLYYPGIYIEPKSRFSYWNCNQVFWEWFSNTAVKIGEAEMHDMRLRNHNYPVTTLGAKISDNYVVDGKSTNAIRFGGLYNEDYIRNWVAESNQTETKAEGEYYTNPSFVDYWDIADVGIVIQPTDELSDPHGNDLYVGNDGSFNDSADNIVAWQSGVDGAGTNFADYENFAFYVTIYGVPEEDFDRKFSFRGYVDFYASTGIESYYDTTLVRSYNMVKAAVSGDKSNEDDVLPDDITPVIAYVPLDDRPVNVERIEYLTGATDFKLLMPEKDLYSTKLDGTGYNSNGKQYGDTEALFNWLQSDYVAENADYYVLSLDQLCSGGLVQSRYETDTDNTFEFAVCDYIVELAQTKKVVVFDTVMRLASTAGYMGYDSTTYDAIRAIGEQDRFDFNKADFDLMVADGNLGNLIWGYTQTGNWSNYQEINYVVNNKDYSQIYKEQYVVSRERKIRIIDHLLRAEGVENLSGLYIGVDDSHPGETVQTNDVTYIKALAVAQGLLIEDDDLKNDKLQLFAGADELGLMGIAACSDMRYGNEGFDYNVTYFGDTQSLPIYADEYDYQSLEDNLNTHLAALGGKNNDIVSKDVLQVLVLTRYDGESNTDNGKIRQDRAEALVETAIDYIEKGYPICIIDGSAYNYTELGRTLMSEAYKNNANLARILGYSNWNTVGNSVGISLSNAVSRYFYIKNAETVTDESNKAFLQSLAFSFIKDIAYQSNRKTLVEPTGTSTPTGNLYTEAEAEEFLNMDNDGKHYFHAPQSVLGMINASDILVGLGEPAKHNKTVTVSDLYYPWNRAFEANFTISVN